MRKGEQVYEREEADPPPMPLTKANRDTKTHHRTGYHKPTKNPTTNAAPDSHKKFCKRCLGYNKGICPMTGKNWPTDQCNI